MQKYTKLSILLDKDIAPPVCRIVCFFLISLFLLHRVYKMEIKSNQCNTNLIQADLSRVSVYHYGRLESIMNKHNPLFHVKTFWNILSKVISGQQRITKFIPKLASVLPPKFSNFEHNISFSQIFIQLETDPRLQIKHNLFHMY